MQEKSAKSLCVGLDCAFPFEVLFSLLSDEFNTRGGALFVEAFVLSIVGDILADFGSILTGLRLSEAIIIVLIPITAERD